MKSNKIKPITLEIEKETWDKFKAVTPRSKTLNDHVVELIEKKVKIIDTGVRR